MKILLVIICLAIFPISSYAEDKKSSFDVKMLDENTIEEMTEVMLKTSKEHMETIIAKSRRIQRTVNNFILDQVDAFQKIVGSDSGKGK